MRTLLIAIVGLVVAGAGVAKALVTEIIDYQGDGAGNELNWPLGITVDSSGNVYVSGWNSDNAFEIATPRTCSTTGTPCTITEIIDATGDGAGNTLDGARGVTVDSSGNVYVTGLDTNNVFKITPSSPIPTLSEWGLVTFGMLLLTAMAVALRRRQAA